MKSGQVVTYLLKLFLFSFLLSTSARNVTRECWEDVTEFLSDLNAEKPKPHAIKSWDLTLSAFLQRLLLENSVDNIANFSCNKIDYYNGICVPDSCQEAEITALAILDIFKFKSTSFLLPFPSLFALNATISFSSVARCAKDLSTIDAFTGICLFISVLFIILLVAGTLYSTDLWRKAKGNKQPSDANYGSTSSMQKLTSTSQTEETQTHKSISGILPLVDGSKQSTLDCIMKCFSLQKNLPAIWMTQSSQDVSLALNGLRSLSLLWVISGHTSQMMAWQNLGMNWRCQSKSSSHLKEIQYPSANNTLEWEAKVLKNPIYIYSQSGPFYLGIDTFFIISGLLSSRSFLKMVDCSEKDINFYIALKYLWNRFLRLQPLHMYSVCVLVGLYSVTPWGALWEFLKLEVENCRRMWWTNLLLINNFIAGPKSCNGWTWYLANDFQFHVITPLLVFLSSRRKCWLVISGIFLFLATFTVTALLSFFYRLPVTNPHDMRQMSTVMHFLEYYSKPYCLLWSVSSWPLSCTVHESPPTINPKNQGFINTILSWSVWTVVARISFACYLVHPVMILLYNGLQETLIHYSDINLFYLFLGHCLMTFMVGLALTVMVEAPLQKLKCLWVPCTNMDQDFRKARWKDMISCRPPLEFLNLTKLGWLF
ncbi:hypothetical protein E2320_017772 [Naja naja]|nr:hypothetical protein E2320_017772 [Naja naja]